MKRLLTLALSLTLLASCTQSDKELKLNEKNIKKIVAAMTLDEKATLVIGGGNTVFTGIGNTMKIVPGAAGSSAQIERLGIAPTVVADGPAGLRISPTREGTEQTYYCTGFPIATALACSWDMDLLYEIGEVMGNEVAEYGVDVLLAPGMNLHRDPLCGRNFEYYSEDPLLTGKAAAAFVNGVQSNGVGTSVKHFAVNNQETNRKDVDVRISVRAMREIYLRGFEIAVREAQPWTVMSAYNMINGQQCMESRELLTTILRDEWGFEGIVLCDWASPGWRNTPKEIWAGNDLVTPGSDIQKQEVIDAVNNGTLSMEDLDTCVERILRYVVRTPRFAGKSYSDTPDLKAHATTARDAATEGMVLLKNSGALPIAKENQNIALFGITSYDFIAGGTGSGNVNKAYVIDLLTGLSEAGYKVDENISTFYADQKAAAAAQKRSAYAGYAFGSTILSEVAVERKMIDKSVADNDLAIITIGRNCGEGADRKVEGDFNLTDIEQALIADVCEAYHAAGKEVVVILNISGVVETASWKEQPDAILLAWLPGQEGGYAVADVLSGKVNPSGKLSMTFPNNYFDCNTAENFPYDYDGPKAIGNYPKIPRPERKNIHYVNYDEDIFVGYRYFDTFDKGVSYPFGYGLSYTTFDYSAAELTKARGGEYEVEVTVTNSGAVAGKEAVQLYFAAPDEVEVDMASHQLLSFGKTRLLAPGESAVLTLRFTERDLSRYDDSASAWVIDGGDYTIEVAASSRDVRTTLPLTIKKSKVVEETFDVLKKQI